MQAKQSQGSCQSKIPYGYDCSNPREVKPISSFVRDPCEPAEANERGTYEIDPPTQYQCYIPAGE